MVGPAHASDSYWIPDLTVFIIRCIELIGDAETDGVAFCTAPGCTYTLPDGFITAAAVTRSPDNSSWIQASYSCTSNLLTLEIDRQSSLRLLCRSLAALTRASFRSLQPMMAANLMFVSLTERNARSENMVQASLSSMFY